VGESLLLLLPTDAPEGTPESRHSRLELHFGIDELDPFVERLAERATPVLQEPTDQPWGEREAIVLDPDGYPVFLVQLSKAVSDQPRPPGPPREPPAAPRAPHVDVKVSCGGDVRLTYDPSVPPNEVRSSHGFWSAMDRQFEINGGAEDAEVWLNPELEVDLRIDAASANIQGVSAPIQARLNVGDVNIQGRFDQGHSRLDCNAGDVNVTLAWGSDVRLRVAPYARWQVHTNLPVTERGEWVLGSGSALLEIGGNLGEINVTTA